MALPGIIEIVPLPRPIQAVITVPGSKSITNRALVLAALGEGETTLHGALWSEDTGDGGVPPGNRVHGERGCRPQ